MIYTLIETHPYLLQASIIGLGGESVRDLERRTSCVINANKDPQNGTFCAEVCSNEEFTALCGAEVFIEHIILKMGFQNSLRLKNDCYYHFFHYGELAKHENLSWRIHLPIHFNEMHGKYLFVSFQRYIDSILFNLTPLLLKSKTL